MDNRDISPLDALENALRFWWVIFLAGIIGGLLGWLFTNFQPPIYEASVIYSVDLDEQALTLPGQSPLSYVEQETYLEPVKALFYTQDIREQIQVEALKSGIELRAEDFNSQDFRIERAYTRWRLIVNNRDPETAAALVNLWADTLFNRLTEITGHATNAERIEVEVTAIQRCFSENDFGQANACAGTPFTSLEAMDAYLTNLNAQLESEQKASRGVTTALGFAILERASVPTEPVLYRKNVTIFAGTAIGLLIGILFSSNASLFTSKFHVKPKN